MSGITNLKLIGLDSNLFIYHFEGNPEYTPFTEKILKELTLGTIKAVTSIISIIETLSYPASQKIIKDITDTFLNIPNLNICDVDWQIALEASRIRREYKFRLPDSVQLATAKLHRAKAFISNDQNLRQFKELKVILLKEV